MLLIGSLVPSCFTPSMVNCPLLFSFGVLQTIETDAYFEASGIRSTKLYLSVIFSLGLIVDTALISSLSIFKAFAVFSFFSSSVS